MMDEIAVLRLLKHPNIILLHELYEDAEHVHLVFELVRGGELQARVQRQKRLSEEEAAEVTRKLLRVLSFCHASDVVHRDVKPRNVVLL